MSKQTEEFIKEAKQTIGWLRNNGTTLRKLPADTAKIITIAERALSIITSLQSRLSAAEGENKELKHILFEAIIAPNCPTCSNQMTKHCDNGIVCMDKLRHGGFLRYDIMKKDTRLVVLQEERGKLMNTLNDLIEHWEAAGLWSKETMLLRIKPILGDSLYAEIVEKKECP